LVQAYVLIQTEVGKAALVAEEVREIPGVDSADDVTGPYDVIVKATSEDVDSLGKLVVAKIQAIDGITRTLTCPVVRARPPDALSVSPIWRQWNRRS
jgi:DNA-binding Lrp family transcriptional regulator